MSFRSRSNGTIRSTGRCACVEESLQRLGLARIDFVFIHDVARDAHGDRAPQRFREAMEGAVPALARLKAEGAIAGYGLGVNDWQVCVDALAHADFDVLLLAGRYTLLDQTALPVLLPLCARRGTRIVIGGPFNSGILATGSCPADGSAPRFDYAPASPDIVARLRGSRRSVPGTPSRSNPQRCNSRARIRPSRPWSRAHARISSSITPSR